MKKLQEMTLDEIKTGYTKHGDDYQCHFCDASFEEGEIYLLNDHFYNAKKAIQKHIRKEHGSVFEQLIQQDKKVCTLTDVQKNLFTYISDGKSDKEIAALTNTTSSTIRHQRFVFKEKAKQAKMYLALYELAVEGKSDDLIDVHEQAKQIDERFHTTYGEEEQVLSTMFTSLEPLRLKIFPAKEKKKIIVLRKIIEGFQKDRRYGETEINAYLKDIYEDFVTLRRYLIEYGFLVRTQDCKYYAMNEVTLKVDEGHE